MQELLDYGRPASVGRAPGAFAEVVVQAVSLCRALVETAGVRLEVRLDDGLHPLRMDAGRLVQVLQNLIENAVHHASPGSTIGIDAATAVVDDRPWIVCHIEDEGPGFRAEDLPRIFEPFFTRRRGGTGLGLSIVQRIVEEHGGTIAAANRPEGGAVVTFSIPCCAPDGDEQRPRPAAAPAAAPAS
jgi:signal transduction histidine kinase